MQFPFKLHIPQWLQVGLVVETLNTQYSGLAVDGLQCQRKCVCTPLLRLTGNLIPYYFIPLQQRMFLILVIRDGQWWLVTGQLSREDDDAR